eukprot:gene38544-46850_t
MNVNHIACVLTEAKRMLQAELVDGAETLVSLFLSASVHNHDDALGLDAAALNSIAEVFTVLGDALYAKKEYRRAYSAYLQAEQRGKGSLLSFKKSTGSSVTSDQDATIRSKQAKCQYALKDITGTLRTLESIPLRYRDLSSHTLLGGCYAELYLTNNAIQSYKEALLLSPLCIEIIEKLVDLGVEMKELMGLLQDAECDPAVVKCMSSGWMQNLVQSIYFKKATDYRKAFMACRDLNNVFPRNLYLLAHTADCSNSLVHDDNTLHIYKQMHKIDKYYAGSMDDFAYLLCQKEASEMELCSLASSLVEGAPHLPQTWVTAAYYCALKKDFENAVNYIDKALVLNPRYFNAYLARGHVYFVQPGGYETALISYSQAHNVSKKMASFSGLVETNIMIGKYKEAANICRDCIKLFPRSPLCFYLMGKVLSKSPTAVSESIKAFAKALKFQPSYAAAAVGLAEAWLSQNKATEAIDCLQQILQKVNTGPLRLCLAKALAAGARHREALEQLQIASGLLGSNDEEVVREAERIESVLRAINQAGSQVGGVEYDEGEESYMEEDGGRFNRSLSYDE